MARVRYIEVTIEKLPMVIITINMEEKNSNLGLSSRLNVLKKNKITKKRD